MKKSKVAFYNENKMFIGNLIQDSNIDDVIFAIQDEIDKKEHHKLNI